MGSIIFTPTALWDTFDQKTQFKLWYLLSFLKHPEERCHGSNIQSVSSYSHDVIKYSGDLGKEDANPLSSFWDLNVQHLLNGNGVRLLIAHH